MRGKFLANIKLVIEYNGAGFHGWQKQPGLRTIEAELEKAISTVLRKPVSPIYAAGRTDAGVHARGQVVNFYFDGELDLERLSRGVSSIMRPELTVISAEFVPQDFHARKSAVSKHYCYTIYNRQNPPVLDYGKVWFVSDKLDLEKMKQEAEKLVGEHDFTSFRASGCGAHSPIKTVYRSEILQDGPYLYYKVSGSGFLKQMVRNIVGTLVAFGRGNNKLSTIEEIINARDRKLAGVTAPAYGLILERVDY
ncbi:MAG: tRNA pseudouridine(38-40) synthase TruA [Candidatus Dadabacteria bacterium]|nr:MAG: tRNA pseudouridine(38-40) synthase TruA [Candidatus Dadabacteria bacterium]